MSNPIFNDKFIDNERVLTEEPMTVNGVVQITAFMGILLVLAAYFVWSKFTLGYTDMAVRLTIGGGIVGFILALIISFTRTKILIPVYSVCEGLFLGGLSVAMEASHPGIVMNAVIGTFATLFAMLFLYRLNIIKCTDKFRSVVFISVFSIAGIYLVDIIGSFFHYSIPLINTSSGIGIGFSLLVVVIAALNLIMDFDFIERCVQSMAPKDYEWYAAFGLMLTLIWLYIEILKLLAKFSDRR